MIKLYSIGCPKCIILEKKLKQKNIQFEITSDTKKIIEIGFTQVPVLEVNGDFMDFKQSNDWINKEDKQ